MAKKQTTKRKQATRKAAKKNRKNPVSSKKAKGRDDAPQSMTGAASAISVAGFRSELLAQFAFTAWGTATATPNPQDHGIDLHCTLTEKIGQRLWAKSPFTIQVKSDMKPWTFKGAKSVQWLIEYPLPLFLCVVRKKKARISVYHTTPRYWVWALGGDWKLLRLKPTDEKEGGRARWKQGETLFSLGAPILDFTASELMNEEFCNQARSVLEAWVAVDNANLTRVRTGIIGFGMPAKYAPNELPKKGYSANYSKTKELASDEQFERALPFFKEALGFVLGELHKRGDVEGAAKALMLRRHPCLFGGSMPFQNEISDALSTEDNEAGHFGIQRLEEAVHGSIEEARRIRKANG